MTNQSDHAWQRVPIAPQSVDAPLSRAAIFLVITVDSSGKALDSVKDVLSDIAGLVKTVGFRDLNAHLSCNVGIGAEFWARATDVRPPRELHPFREVRGKGHTAVSTPGDVLFHIRAERGDFCFEFERLLLEALGDAVRVTDEVSGFRYFDSRDLLGFVDGTANPAGARQPQRDSTSTYERMSGGVATRHYRSRNHTRSRVCRGTISVVE